MEETKKRRKEGTFHFSSRASSIVFLISCSFCFSFSSSYCEKLWTSKFRHFIHSYCIVTHIEHVNYHHCFKEWVRNRSHDLRLRKTKRSTCKLARGPATKYNFSIEITQGSLLRRRNGICKVILPMKPSRMKFK